MDTEMSVAFKNELVEPSKMERKGYFIVLLTLQQQLVALPRRFHLLQVPRDRSTQHRNQDLWVKIRACLMLVPLQPPLTRFGLGSTVLRVSDIEVAY